jgi:hypothetical protein
MPRPMPVTVDPRAYWRDEAACSAPAAGMESAWIQEEHPKNMAARAVCVSECPVRYQCILSALSDEDAEGVLGGYHFDQGGLATRDRRKLRDEFGFTARAVRKAGRAA